MRFLTAIGVTILAAGLSARLAHGQAPPRGIKSLVPFHLINQPVSPGLINSPRLHVERVDAPAQDLGINSRQRRMELVGDNQVRLTGDVEMVGGRDETWQLHADQVDVFPDESRLVATGNVVFTSEGGRIEAERVEFDIDSETGTFFNASVKRAPANQ